MKADTAKKRKFIPVHDIVEQLQIDITYEHATTGPTSRWQYYNIWLVKTLQNKLQALQHSVWRIRFLMTRINFLISFPQLSGLNTHLSWVIDFWAKNLLDSQTSMAAELSYSFTLVLLSGWNQTQRLIMTMMTTSRWPTVWLDSEIFATTELSNDATDTCTSATPTCPPLVSEWVSEQFLNGTSAPQNSDYVQNNTTSERDEADDVTNVITLPVFWFGQKRTSREPALSASGQSPKALQKTSRQQPQSPWQCFHTTVMPVWNTQEFSQFSEW